IVVRDLCGNSYSCGSQVIFNFLFSRQDIASDIIAYYV
ncbi:unnamed protein product, partial [Staurois parvus]